MRPTARPKASSSAARSSDSPASREPDLADYSFDRAVICDRARTVNLLLANNFHFENNCAVLSIDGYPPRPFPTVRAMIRRNPKLQVFAVHDATPAGCRLAYRLSSDPDWFGGRIKVVNVGLRPGHATKLRGLYREGGDGDADAGEGVTEVESRWLSRYALELAAFRPELILKAPFPGDPPSHRLRRPPGSRDPPRRVHLQPRSDPGSSGLLRISDGP